MYTIRTYFKTGSDDDQVREIKVIKPLSGQECCNINSTSWGKSLHEREYIT